MILAPGITSGTAARSTAITDRHSNLRGAFVSVVSVESLPSFSALIVAAYLLTQLVKAMIQDVLGLGRGPNGVAAITLDSR